MACRTLQQQRTEDVRIPLCCLEQTFKNASDVWQPLPDENTLIRCLPQVSSAVHVYGHSHINADITLPTAAALATINHAGSSSSSSRRYVQYALDAVGAESAGLYCLWDGGRLAAPGVVVPVTGP
jgi:hypothetical protein